MSICYSIFQKEITQLSLEDLEAFFSTEQEESSILEFKMGDIDLEAIHKEVAAFANTEGGLLIIGAPKETRHPERKHLKICCGALTASKVRDQDTLIRSIASNISPSPTHIKAKALHIEGGSVYVLEIGQSLNPPHQVSASGVYYIRMERDAKPAPHGLVEALFFRRQKSDLWVKPHILVKPHNQNIQLSFHVRNESIVHIDQCGWQLKLFGVRGKTETANIKLGNITDDYTGGVEVMDSLLVKGMVIVIEVNVQLRFPIFYFHFSYYSKDAMLETIVGLYDTQQGAFRHLLDSKHPINNIGTSDNIKMEYRSALQEIMMLFLKKGYFFNDLQPGAKKEAIELLEYELGISLPESLTTFLMLTDGFAGIIGDCTFGIYPVIEIKTMNKGQSYGSKEMQIVIGMIHEKSIYLKLKNGRPFFVWFTHAGHFSDNDTSSFFDLLEDLYRCIENRD
jgi:hypothetical protein